MGGARTAEAELLAVLEEQEARFAEVVRRGFQHAGVPGLVLTEGTWWKTTSATRLRTGTELSSALVELHYHPGAVYVEGYLLNEHGDAVAASWVGRDETVLDGPLGRAYLGVPLAADWVARYSKRHGMVGALHSQKAANYDLLANGLPPDARLDGTGRGRGATTHGESPSG